MTSAINGAIDIRADQLWRHGLPDQGADPDPDPGADPDPDHQPDPDPDRNPDHCRDHPEPGPGPPTRAVVSMPLPTTGATKQDDDDVAEVTTDIAIDNTDLTSLAGDWFSKLVLVTGNVQITNNAVLSTMDASFQKLDTVSGNLDIVGNGLLSGCARLGVPVSRRRGVW